MGWEPDDELLLEEVEVGSAGGRGRGATEDGYGNRSVRGSARVLDEGCGGDGMGDEAGGSTHGVMQPTPMACLTPKGNEDSGASAA